MVHLPGIRAWGFEEATHIFPNPQLYIYIWFDGLSCKGQGHGKTIYPGKQVSYKEQPMKGSLKIPDFERVAPRVIQDSCRMCVSDSGKRELDNPICTVRAAQGQVEFSIC